MKLNDQEFLAAEIEMGIGFHNPGFVGLASATANQLTGLIDYESVLDYGCGTGVYSDAFQKLGKNVVAFDVSPAHIDYVKQNAPSVKIAKKPITTDLLVFIEVAEHMTDAEIKKLMGQISPRFILFSSTSARTENDEKWGHINVKDQAEWIKVFASYGYRLRSELPTPTSYTKLFERIPEKKDDNENAG